jgi:cardiolipin synthase
MSDWFGLALPWWGWLLMIIGIISVVSVFGALFLPDWPEPDYAEGFDADPGSEAFVMSAAGFLNVPVLRAHEVSLLENGDAFYPSMLDAIRNARDTINFEVYIFEPDEVGQQFMEAFEERVRAGVEVRLLVDGFGSWKLNRQHRKRLRDAGIKIERFRPLALRNLVRIYRRTHRRAIVIDGRIAYIGGAAVSHKWAGNVRTSHEWRDSMTRVTGPLVAGIQSAFATNWVYCTGEVIAGPRFHPSWRDGGDTCGLSVVSSPSDAMQPIRLLFWLSFINARRRLWICNSYFIPDVRLRDAELLAAGVRIFEFQPAMMHAKTVVVDDCWSIVGSANLDERSMELNEENVLGVADAGLTGAISQGMEHDITRSREVRLDEWRRRPVWQRGLEALAKALIEQY